MNFLTEGLIDCVIVVVLLAIAAIFTAVETALISISHARIEDMDETRSTRTLLAILDNRARFINPLILVRTACEAGASVIITVLAIRLIHEAAVVVAIVLLTLLSYVFLGVVGRTVGRQNPYTVGLRAAFFLRPIVKLFSPLASLLIWLGNVFTPGKKFEQGPFTNEVELREMVDIASERGVVQVEERRMIQAIFDLANTRARKVMVPRTDMLWIESEKSARQATRLCVRSGHSRIPVVGENVDDIEGVVYLKDLVALSYDDPSKNSTLVKEVMRPAEFVPDSLPLDELLGDMQTSHDHIALLVDEFGAIAGLISIEDILEEIVGEISDEYDEDEVAPVEELDDGSFRLVARFSLDELVELYDEKRGIDIEFSEEQLEDVETVAGLLAFELGRVPLPGAQVTTAGLTFRAEGGHDRRGRIRITSVVVSRSATSSEPVNGDDSKTGIVHSGTGDHESES